MVAEHNEILYQNHFARRGRIMTESRAERVSEKQTNQERMRKQTLEHKQSMSHKESLELRSPPPLKFISATKLVLALKDKPPQRVSSIPKVALQFRDKKNSAKELLPLAPVRSSQSSICSRRPSSPHESGYVTSSDEDHHSFDEVSSCGDGSNSYEEDVANVGYCVVCFSYVSNIQRQHNKYPLPRSTDHGQWSNHIAIDERGLVVCPRLASRVCGICGATGSHAHLTPICTNTTNYFY